LNMISRIAEKLRDREYRKAFVVSQINIGIPFQVRALLKSRGKTQEWLAKQTGMLQPRVSGLMTPGRTRPNIETLRRLAEAFDCGLAVRFVPFSELARWSASFDPESFNVPEFENDIGFIERKRPPAAALSDNTGSSTGSCMQIGAERILSMNTGSQRLAPSVISRATSGGSFGSIVQNPSESGRGGMLGFAR